MRQFKYGPLTAYIGGTFFQFVIVLGCLAGLWSMGYHAGERAAESKHTKLYTSVPGYPACDTLVYSNNVYIGCIKAGESNITQSTNTP